MPFKLFALDPIKRFALFLAIFALGALIYNFSNEVLLHLALTLGWGLLLYGLYSWLSSKHKNIWDTVITTLILFLLLHHGDPSQWFYPVLATFLAITLKFFVEFKGSPIVNPAAGSLLLMAGIVALISGVEQPFISWWGTSYWQLPFGVSVSLILMAIWILGGLSVWRKFPIFLSFLLGHAAIFYFRIQDPEALRFVFTDSTIYFFTGIMLVEPKTSPILPWKQASFGLIAAAAVNLFAYLLVPYYELFALLVANLFNALSRLRKASV